MKALVISDVHSNIVALHAVLDAEPHYDKLICCGDLVDFGPCPKEVLTWFRNHEVLCVQGNHDRSVVRVYRSMQSGESPDTREGLKWAVHNAQRLDDSDITYLDDLPETISFTMDGFEYVVQHCYDGYELIQSVEAFDAFFATRALHNEGRPKRSLFGHTHRQCIHILAGNREWMNPGSISYRHSGDTEQDAHYAVIEDGRMELKRVDFDLTKVLAALDEDMLSKSAVDAANRFWR